MSDEHAHTAPAEGRRRSTVLSSLLEVVIIVGAAFVLALLIQQFVVKPFYIPSVSMEDTLQEGDRVLVNRFIYRFSDIHRGDVVVFDPPVESDEPYIKRVVAVAGDSVEVKDGRLWVNGQPQDEPYLKEPVMTGSFPRTTVPEGDFWAMGDNRNQSGDSRVFGPVREDEVLGRAFVIYWPIDKIGGL